MTLPEQQTHLECLRLALEAAPRDALESDVIEAAERFHAFVTGERGKPVPRPGGKRRLNYPAIARDYQSGMSMSQCAVRHGCSPPAILFALRKEGVPSRYGTNGVTLKTGRSTRADTPIMFQLPN
jgi:hypothetical protein